MTPRSPTRSRRSTTRTDSRANRRPSNRTSNGCASDSTSPPRCANRSNHRMNVGTFVGIVALMFVLELPDKTFLATVIMATRARPLMVVIGGSLALVIQMGIAVGAGTLLTFFPTHWKDLIVGALFLAGAAYLLFVTESEEEEKGRREAEIEKAATRWKEI